MSLKRKVTVPDGRSGIYMRSIVFVAKPSSARTACSRCSSFVSSSFVCERPRRLWTKTITVGVRARALGAFVERAARKAVGRAGDFLDRLVGELDQLVVEQDRLDVPNPLPVDVDIALCGEAGSGLPRGLEHRGELLGLEVALVEQALGG